MFIAIACKNTPAASEAFASYHVIPASNDSLIGVLPESYAWSWLTNGHCSCDFYSDPYYLDAEIEKIQKKYTKPKFRKRGWNDKRIADEIARLRATRTSTPGGLVDGLFESLLHVAQQDGNIYFVVNYFSGRIDRDSVDIFDEAIIGSGSGIERPDQIRKNVLYSFK